MTFQYSKDSIDADTLDYHHNIDLLQDLKVVGTQLYPGFPLHRPEETSMIPRPIVMCLMTVIDEEDQINPSVRSNVILLLRHLLIKRCKLNA